MARILRHSSSHVIYFPIPTKEISGVFMSVFSNSWCRSLDKRITRFIKLPVGTLTQPLGHLSQMWMCEPRVVWEYAPKSDPVSFVHSRSLLRRLIKYSCVFFLLMCIFMAQQKPCQTITGLTRLLTMEILTQPLYVKLDQL